MKYPTPEPCGLTMAQARVDVEYIPESETPDPQKPLPNSTPKELTPTESKRAAKVLAPIFLDRLKRKRILKPKKKQ